MAAMDIPSREDFLKGIAAFKAGEPRDAMYRVAVFLVSKFWGRPPEMADGLGVLLLTWNSAFYRYGGFDFYALETCIADNLNILDAYRARGISSLSDSDEGSVRRLFDEFLGALRISSGKGKDRRSPVAVAKALHLLAPNFFPIWDHSIAKAFGCPYDRNPGAQYVRFCKKMKQFAETAVAWDARGPKSVLKLMDEYSYSKYTKQWM